jgi:hypothetical protein
MGLWQPASITEEPEVVLANWCIFELENGDRHFCGYNVLLREGRVSSRIEEFDQQRMLRQTRSGRVYTLQGPPGRDADATYVWYRWCAINGLDPASAKNISKEIANGG